MLEIYTLIENNIGTNKRIENEYGLSFYIKCNDVNILFDTGSTNKFLNNASLLSLNLHKVDYTILSHGHYDHTGGFQKFVEEYGSDFKLVINEKLFNRKYKDDGAGIGFIGNEFDNSIIDEYDIEVINVDNTICELSKGIFVVNGFKRTNEIEELNNRYVIDNNAAYEVDSFDDEVCLVLETEKGLVVLVGCSHVGIMNILDTVKEKISTNIYAVLGGIHLNRASQDRIDATINYFEKNNIKKIGLNHCSGDKTINKFREKFNEKVFNNNSGYIFKI